MLGYTAYSRDIRQIDFRSRRRRQFNLGFLGSFFQTLQCHRVLFQIYSFFCLEVSSQPVDNHLVEIITSEVSITIGRKHLEYTATKLQYGNIKCTAPQIEDSNLHVLIRLIHTVSQSRSRRFIHNTFHFQTGNLSGLFRRLTLRIGKISRHGNHCFRHFLTQIILSRLLHLLENHGRDFLRSIETTLNIHTRRVVISFYN